ncbi:hypothetical protein [uncultured Tateyamaria sp.]|uniref:hypothetical protein n=1 Tax=uncultured Tateyamaria sp. TaxID=455651 RepID=UPI00262EA8BC|nr:hypothetical protein [uncultured Tateyamaria sp.]
MGYFDLLAPPDAFNANVAHHSFNCAAGDCTEDDAAAFHARFTTLTLLSAKLGQGSRSISQRLKAAGIERFRPGDTYFGPVYLLDDVESVLHGLECRDLVSKSN